MKSRASCFLFYSFVLWFFCSTNSALASEASQGRAEIWRQKRLEKPQAAEDHQTGLEKRLVWLEDRGLQNLLNIHYKGFYPKFGNLSTGSGFAPGVRYRNADMNGSPVDLQASGAYSFRQYQLYDLQFGVLHRKGSVYQFAPNGPAVLFPASESRGPKRDLFLYADFRYRNFPQEDFFGVGPDSKNSNRTDFLFEDMSYDAVAGYQFTRWISAAARAGFLQVNAGPGEDRRFPNTHQLFNDALAPGLARQPDFLRLNSMLFVDYRDHPTNPKKGGVLGFSFSRFDDRGGREFEFNRFALDARHYLPLGSVQRVLAARFYTSFDDAGPGSRVPFYLMETVGGSDTLRGFREFRFRDANLLYLSAEYRWEPAPALEFAIFYDTGKVFSDRSDFELKHLEKSIGAGIRLKSSDGVVFRVDVGRSREGTRVYFKWGPAF